MSRRRPQRGATIVESAVIMLLFFTIIFAIFEFGRILNVYHTITNAAREGARYSVAPFPGVAGSLPSTGSVQTQVCTFLTAASLPCSGIAINQNFLQGGVSYTKVDISAPYTFVVLPLPVLTLTTSAVMRNETN